MDKEIEKIALDIQNNKVSKEKLIELSKHENIFIRSLVASSIDTPLNIIKKLSQDQDPLVVSSALDNPKFPKKELQKRIKSGLNNFEDTKIKAFKVDLDNILK